MVIKKKPKKNKSNKQVNKKLSLQDKLFCKEYPKNFNGTDAYLKAGHKCTRESAAVEACKLLRKPNIQEEIIQQVQDAFDKADITAQEVIKQLTDVSRSTLGDYVDFEKEAVYLKNSEKITKEKIALLGEISKTTQGYKIKLQDRMKARELLGRYFALFTDKIGLDDETLEALGVIYYPKKK